MSQFDLVHFITTLLVFDYFEFQEFLFNTKAKTLAWSQLVQKKIFEKNAVKVAHMIDYAFNMPGSFFLGGGWGRVRRENVIVVVFCKKLPQLSEILTHIDILSRKDIGMISFSCQYSTN